MSPEAAEFWNLVVREGLPRFRYFRRPTLLEILDGQFLGGRLHADWESLKAKILPGDQIWPFEFHVRAYLGLRRGYIVLRRGRPVGGIVTEVS
jgi:hypothetical protein